MRSVPVTQDNSLHTIVAGQVPHKKSMSFLSAYPRIYPKWPSPSFPLSPTYPHAVSCTNLLYAHYTQPSLHSQPMVLQGGVWEETKSPHSHPRCLLWTYLLQNVKTLPSQSPRDVRQKNIAPRWHLGCSISIRATSHPGSCWSPCSVNLPISVSGPELFCFSLTCPKKGSLGPEMPPYYLASYHYLPYPCPDY